MLSNPQAFRVFTGFCPDPECRTKLYFPSYAGSNIECTRCGQHHLKSSLLNVELVTDPEVALRSLLRSSLLSRSSFKKEAELVKVKGYSNYHCKLLAPLMTRYGMERTSGKARLLKDMNQGDSFDCSHIGDRAFVIEPEFLETIGYGKDKTGAVTYLADTLTAIKSVNNMEERLVPIHVDGDGHCLVHAVSRALIGREIFWHALRTNLSSNFQQNLAKYRALFKDFIDEAEWRDIIKEASPNFVAPEGQSLGMRNIHVFGLANVLHRPIVLLDKLSGMQSIGDYSATFLPALIPVHECKSKNGQLYPPLVIAWSSAGHNHYIPLVGVSGRPIPKCPRWLVPKAWGLPNELIDAYIKFDENDCCNIGGEHCLPEKYIQRLMRAMDEQFLEIHSVTASLITDVHQFLYKSSGLVGISPQMVIESTQQSIKDGHLKRCLSCHAVLEQKPPVNEEWLRPGGDMYTAASQTPGGLIDAQMYTFPQQELVCSYDQQSDVLHPVKHKGLLLSACTLCKGPLRTVKGDGSPVYINGDRTSTPVQGASTCKCGFKHFWDGKEYDNLPEVIPVTLEWGGKAVKETVHWFQNERDVSMNSNVYAVASKLVQKYFPGEFGSERLVQKVVDTILRQTAKKEGENKGARPDIPGLASVSSLPKPEGAAVDKFVPSKIILTGEKKKTFHKEELTMSEAEKLIRTRTEHHAAVMQKRQSGSTTVKKTPEKGSPPPKQVRDKQVASPVPEKKLSTPPLSPRTEKKIRLSSSKGGQATLSLPLDATYRQLQDAIHKELGVQPEHQKIRYGFPPRTLSPPEEGNEGEAVPIQHGDRVMVEVIIPPEPEPEQKPDVEMADEEKSDVSFTSSDIADKLDGRGLKMPVQEEQQMEVDTSRAALASALVNALSGAINNELWEAACQNPALFSSGGFYFDMVKKDLGDLKDDQHLTIPHFPGKVFAYSNYHNRLELCLGKIHLPVQPLTAEALAQAHQASSSHQRPSSVLNSEASFSGAVHHQDSRHERVAFSGEGRSLSSTSQGAPRPFVDEPLAQPSHPSSGFPLPRNLRPPTAAGSSSAAAPVALLQENLHPVESTKQGVPIADNTMAKENLVQSCAEADRSGDSSNQEGVCSADVSESLEKEVTQVIDQGMGETQSSKNKFVAQVNYQSSDHDLGVCTEAPGAPQEPSGPIPEGSGKYSRDIDCKLPEVLVVDREDLHYHPLSEVTASEDTKGGVMDVFEASTGEKNPDGKTEVTSDLTMKEVPYKDEDSTLATPVIKEEDSTLATPVIKDEDSTLATPVIKDEVLSSELGPAQMEVESTASVSKT